MRMNVMSRSGTGDDALDPGAFSPRRAHEQRPAAAFACPPAVAVALAVLALVAVLIAFGAGGLSSGARLVAGAIAVAAVLVVLAIVPLAALRALRHDA